MFNKDKTWRQLGNNKSLTLRKMSTKYNTLLLIHIFKKHLSKNWNYKKKKKFLSSLWYFPQDHIPTFFFLTLSRLASFFFLFIFEFLVFLIPYLTYTRPKKKKKSFIICTNSCDKASFLYYYLRSSPICGLHFFGSKMAMHPYV